LYAICNPTGKADVRKPINGDCRNHHAELRVLAGLCFKMESQSLWRVLVHAELTALILLDARPRVHYMFLVTRRQSVSGAQSLWAIQKRI
jgi:hypothetical protein